MSAIHSLYEQAAADTVAIGRLEGDPVMYGQLREHSRQCGAWLQSLSDVDDFRVAIVMPNGPLMALTFAACVPWVTVAPLNPSYTEDEFEFYFDDLKPSLLLVEAGIPSKSVGVANRLGIRVVELDGSSLSSQLVETEDASANPVDRELDGIALILHTSGTTSRPKMVPLTQRNLLASARNISTTLRLTSQDRCLNIMPLFHIHGLMAPIMATLYAGASVVCTPGFDALRFYGWLDSTKPTWYSAVPTMHQAIVSRAKRNEAICKSNRLRFIRSSSASLPAQVLAQLESAFNTRVVEAYAMTEAAHQMCSNPLEPHPRKPGTVGPQAGPDVRIASLTEMHFLDSGTEGEIVIQGENVTTGYLNNPEANARDFKDGWFRTGDLGVMDEEGYVTVTGRLKEIINRGGEKIAPLEVDSVLLDHPAIDQVCTFAVPHKSLGEAVGAIVVLEEGADVTVEEIRDFASSRLAPFKVPRTVVFLDEIPKGATGKVQRIGMAERIGLQT